MKYFLKKCGYQELGSVQNGHASRGRYLFVSKDTHVLSMFPPLSETQLNDSSIIPVLPLYSDKKVYCKFIYHNSEIAAPSDVKGRNEYRLYLNRDLENDQHLFDTDDIVIIRTAEVSGEDGDTQTIYILDLLKNHNTQLYIQLNTVIETSNIRGKYGIYEGVLSEFEAMAEQRLNNVQDAIAAIDDTVTQEIENSGGDALSSLFNSVSFRDFVMVGYESLCAVTGMAIKFENLINLEAAHIKPKSHGGLYLPNNGFALCRDIHWAFDKGFITLNDNLEVIVHERVTSKWLHSFSGKQIRIPKDPFFRPSLDNLVYHRDNVYGLFLTSGRL